MTSGTTRSFWAAAARTPDRPAVIDQEGRGPSFGELASRAGRLARVLRAHGAQAGDHVLGVAGNSVEFFEFYLACLESGLYFVPSGPRTSAQDMAWVIADCQPVLALVADGHEQVTAALSSTAHALSGDRAPVLMSTTPHAGFEHLEPLIAAAEPLSAAERVAGARMLYTGGTTGRPKGVRFPLPEVSPAEAAERSCALWAARLGYEQHPGAHLVACPLYHGLALMTASVALHLGNTLVLMDRWDPEVCLGQVERHAVTTTAMVPTMLARLLRLPPEVREAADLSSLRALVHSGAPCPVPLKHQLLDWLGDVVWEFYGASEAVGTAVGPHEWRDRPGTVGRPLSRSEIVIVAEDGSPQPPGMVGEILVKGANGPAHFTGSAPVRAGFAAWPDFVSAGDIGYLDDDGFLFITDRVADIIVSGGVNVYSARVEAVIASLDDVELVSVIGRPDPDWGEQVVAVVQPRAGSRTAVISEQIDEVVRRQLAPAQRPKSVHFVSTMPTTRVGKIDKRALKELT